MSFDPNRLLSEAIQAARDDLALPDTEDLGRRILGWIHGKLSSENVDSQTEAEEIYSDFLLRVSRRFQRDPSAVDMPWFWTVAKSAYLNHLTRKVKQDRERLRIEGDSRELLTGVLQGAATVDGLEWDEERILDLVRQAYAGLAPRFREYLSLYLIQRKDPAEIASVMGLEPKSMAALKAKALRALRNEILERI